MGFPRQEYWGGLPFTSPEDLPNSGTEPRSPALQVDSLPEPPSFFPLSASQQHLLLLITPIENLSHGKIVQPGKWTGRNNGSYGVLRMFVQHLLFNWNFWWQAPIRQRHTSRVNWRSKFRTQNFESLESITKIESVGMGIEVERWWIGVEEVYSL